MRWVAISAAPKAGGVNAGGGLRSGPDVVRASVRAQSMIAVSSSPEWPIATVETVVIPTIIPVETVAAPPGVG